MYNFVKNVYWKWGAR